MPATALDPKTALVVIDLQKGIAAFPTVRPMHGIVSNTARLVEAFRRAELPVVLVTVTPSADGGDRLRSRSDVPARAIPMSPEFAQPVPELEAKPGDILITKRQPSAFYGTEFDQSPPTPRFRRSIQPGSDILHSVASTDFGFGRTVSVASSLLAAFIGLEGAAHAAPDPLWPDPAVPIQPDVKPAEPADPTGGAYTSPTLLFIPAAAVPKWNLRVIASTEVQAPADVDAKIRPGFGLELGLPAGITLAAGTTWVGGDVNSANKTDFNLGLSPYGQARVNIIGRPDGRGFLLGASTTYKFVGFEGDPGEIEFAVSSQYRQRYYEVGLQGVIGKDFATTDADGEVHAYALYRPLAQLGLGAAGQLRKGLVLQPGEVGFDLIGGALVSVTLGRFQIGALGGASTLGLPSPTSSSRTGGLGQMFLTARF